MSIYFGNGTVEDLYVGLTPVSKGYVGTHLFYNGDNTIIDITYEKYVLNTQFNTLYNTEEASIKSAILKGSTKYRDIDTGDILDTFDETKNLELVSVKMPVLTTTGKNLFDIDKAVKIDEEKFNETKYVSNNNGVLTLITDKPIEFVISKEKFEVNTQYTLSFKVLGTAAFHSGWIKVYHTDGSEKILANSATPNVESFIEITSDANKTVDRISIFGNGLTTPEFYDIQVEKGVQSSSYEPYKSNILTVNEDVTLRGIGNVKDELDLMTGELTQRITEIVLSGSENWSQRGYGIFIIKLSELNSSEANTNWSKISCLSDNMPIRSHQDNKIYGGTHNTNAISTGGDEICVNLRGETTGSTTKEYVKTWLSQNPITVQYQLATESIKTVDLSVVDQDGNNTKLNTFDDITHVTLSSEGLIPEAELEVATKNEEVLNTMSLEMDDISTTQTTLKKTSNVQSENIDSTMIATTEIYEGLL